MPRAPVSPLNTSGDVKFSSYRQDTQATPSATKQTPTPTPSIPTGARPGSPHHLTGPSRISIEDLEDSRSPMRMKNLFCGGCPSSAYEERFAAAHETPEIVCEKITTTERMPRTAKQTKRQQMTAAQEAAIIDSNDREEDLFDVETIDSSSTALRLHQPTAATKTPTIPSPAGLPCDDAASGDEGQRHVHGHPCIHPTGHQSRAGYAENWRGRRGDGEVLIGRESQRE